MRCPSCAKLYKVDSDWIHSSSPHFECQYCKTQFTFDYPPTHPHSIATRPLKLPKFTPVSQMQIEEGFVRKCPKCGTFNTKTAEECKKCHVILAKLEGLPLEPKQGALPSLVRAWQELMSDYDNIKKHVAFVDRCEDLQALPFALKKYQSLREAQPQDEMAQKMFQQLWMKSLSRQAGHVYKVSRLQSLVERINWNRFWQITPWVILALMFVVGVSFTAYRNLVGISVALSVVYFGIKRR